MRRVSSTLSIGVLRNMIERMRKSLKKLERRRAKYMRHFHKIEARIALISGNATPARPGGRRRRNETNLADALHHVLSKSSEPLGIREIAQRVENSGYTSTSANFPGIVNLTLIKDKRFARAARGMYGLSEAKVTAAVPAAASPEQKKGKRRTPTAKRKRKDTLAAFAGEGRV